MEMWNIVQGMEAQYGIGRIAFMPLVQGVETQYGIGRIGFMPLLQGVEARYGMIFKTLFFIWFVHFLKKMQ